MRRYTEYKLSRGDQSIDVRIAFPSVSFFSYIINIPKSVQDSELNAAFILSSFIDSGLFR